MGGEETKKARNYVVEQLRKNPNSVDLDKIVIKLQGFEADDNALSQDTPLQTM